MCDYLSVNPRTKIVLAVNDLRIPQSRCEPITGSIRDPRGSLPSNRRKV